MGFDVRIATKQERGDDDLRVLTQHHAVRLSKREKYASVMKNRLKRIDS